MDSIPSTTIVYRHREIMSQQSLYEWHSLHDLNRSLHDLDNEGKSYYSELNPTIAPGAYTREYRM